MKPYYGQAEKTEKVILRKFIPGNTRANRVSFLGRPHKNHPGKTKNTRKFSKAKTNKNYIQNYNRN